MKKIDDKIIANQEMTADHGTCCKSKKKKKKVRFVSDLPTIREYIVSTFQDDLWSSSKRDTDKEQNANHQLSSASASKDRDGEMSCPSASKLLRGETSSLSLRDISEEGHYDKPSSPVSSVFRAETNSFKENDYDEPPSVFGEYKHIRQSAIREDPYRSRTTSSFSSLPPSPVLGSGRYESFSDNPTINWDFSQPSDYAQLLHGIVQTFHDYESVSEIIEVEHVRNLGSARTYEIIVPAEQLGEMREFDRLNFYLKLAIIILVLAILLVALITYQIIVVFF